MKSKSNRLITIETNRTVMVRQTTLNAQEWDFDYGPTSGAPTETPGWQSSTDNSPRTTALRPEARSINRTYGTNRLGAGEPDSTFDSLGERPAVVQLTRAGRASAQKQPVSVQSNLNDLLDWLGEDRESAGIHYEEIRRALIKIFACRGVHISEDLADKTIDRVVRKLPDIKENYHGRPIDYFCGVAKKIYLEHTRQNVPRLQVLPPPPEVNEEEFDRLERCLSKLPGTDRSLILEYYGGERKQKINGRKQLAEKLGIPLNALLYFIERNSVINLTIGTKTSPDASLVP